jgi:hypothetical protein
VLARATMNLNAFTRGTFLSDSPPEEIVAQSKSGIRKHSMRFFLRHRDVAGQAPAPWPVLIATNVVEIVVHTMRTLASGAFCGASYAYHSWTKGHPRRSRGVR